METKENKTQKVPVLPIRGLTIFPGSVLHFDIARKNSISALASAMNDFSQHIFITAQNDIALTDVSGENLFEIGVYARILQLAKIQDGIVRVVLQGLSRAKAVEYQSDDDNNLFAFVELLPEMEWHEDDPQAEDAEAMTNIVRQQFDEFVMLNGSVPQDMIITVHEMKAPGQLADYIADNIIRDYTKKQEILEILDPMERIEKVIAMFRHENNVLELEERINEKTKSVMDESQKEYYLRERLRAIHDELGDSEDTSDEVAEYYDKIEKLQTTDENKDVLRKEARKIEKMQSGSVEANVIRNYLDTCLELPWGIYTKEKTDIKKIAVHLDKQHYGLKKVKENIIEALAVRKLNPDVNGQIICLAGPPGVGKTSIAKSIAEATGRSYQRIALGGVHDEAEIRGHRRTYIGAMMGRIMNAVKLAGSANPLILLDEVDKLGMDMRGDPTSALLEVLDGEQNSTFYDHYIDLPFDLSKVMFITTANDYTSIPSPLLDRMDIIHVDSYTREEKFRIAKLHLISKQIKKHGLTARQFKLTDDAVYDIIDSYTREAGVRTLERTIDKLMNKAAVKIVSGEAKSVTVTYDTLEDYLGARKFKRDTIGGQDEIGLATGLAWTSVGGETLPVEVSVMQGSGKIELTGSLGDVMKESAHAAYTCVRTMSDKLHIDGDFYKNKDIHIHVPEGAVPKDGPSAGITLATAITSALTGIPVRRDVAMTGEITIRGRVLPIGGLKEKAMAAYRFGIKTVIIPQENKSDLDELDDIVKDSITFVCADNINTVFDTALVR